MPTLNFTLLPNDGDSRNTRLITHVHQGLSMQNRLLVCGLTWRLGDYSDETARYPGPDMPDRGQDRDLAKYKMHMSDPLNAI